MAEIVPMSVAPPPPVVCTLADGTRLRIRPITPADEDALSYGLRHLSWRSSYQRFLSVRKDVSRAQLHYLTHLDQVRHLALGAETVGREGQAERGVGVARSVFLEGSGDMAEYAIAITDAYQGKGVGSLLLGELSRWAYRTGIRRFFATQLADNEAVLRITRRVATELERKMVADGILEIIWRLEPPESWPAPRIVPTPESPGAGASPPSR